MIDYWCPICARYISADEVHQTPAGLLLHSAGSWSLQAQVPIDLPPIYHEVTIERPNEPEPIEHEIGANYDTFRRIQL